MEFGEWEIYDSIWEKMEEVGEIQDLLPNEELLWSVMEMASFSFDWGSVGWIEVSGFWHMVVLCVCRILCHTGLRKSAFI